MDADRLPRTLIEAVRYFEDQDRCLDFMAALRWPGGVECPRCGSKEVTFLAAARVWKCRGKHKAQKFSIKVGTIMEDSPIGLSKWLPAIWLIVNCKNGVSSYEVHRALKVTQKTAWFMLHRIRLAMQETGGGLLGGPGKAVEVDESFIGGAARWMSKSRHKKAVTAWGPYKSGKAIVMAMLERGGRVRARVVKGTGRNELMPHVVQHVAKGTTLHTDENRAYDGIVAPHFEHEIINHAKEYVRGNVHTNGVENFWACLKRGIRGTYVSVEPFHLFRYLDEQAFRFNERKHPLGDGGRFIAALRQIVGRRLTYAELTGAGLLGPTTA
jgi:transposase-like protein